MASLFAHMMIPVTMRVVLGRKLVPSGLLLAACAASILPDIDVLAFQWGIPYRSDFGHRGITHSVVFAVLMGLFAFLGARRFGVSRQASFAVVFLSCASHGILDAMTNGGLGVAFFWPWSEARYFLPWRPITVSPIGAARFFSEHSLVILRSEATWVLLPSLVVMALSYSVRRWGRRMAER